MPRPFVSIVLATYQRAHLLKRSLVCYQNSLGIDVNKDLEVVVIDDSSTDGTKELVESWSKETGIRSVVLTPYPKDATWRDCGASLNYGIRASLGRHIILTHPEVMPGPNSVAKCADQLERAEIHRSVYPETSPFGLYACCRIYYLSPRDQTLIDTVNWREKGTLAVREIEGFYEPVVGGNPDYSHTATELVGTPGYRIQTWESWVWGGCSRETWKRLGGMLVTNRWGSVDIAFSARRQVLGIPNYTCPDDTSICVHQNHSLPGDVETHRDMDAWVQELKDHDLKNPAKLVYPEVDELGW